MIGLIVLLSIPLATALTIQNTDFYASSENINVSITGALYADQVIVNESWIFFDNFRTTDPYSHSIDINFTSTGLYQDAYLIDLHQTSRPEIVATNDTQLALQKILDKWQTLATIYVAIVLIMILFGLAAGVQIDIQTLLIMLAAAAFVLIVGGIILPVGIELAGSAIT